MEDFNKIVLFEQQQIRRVWHNEQWYFVVNDIITLLTETTNPANYLKQLRHRDKELSKGWLQIVTPLPFETEGGKQKMNCANTEGVLRLIMSIPSAKAEPFKQWLAMVGNERILEMENPEIGIERIKEIYKSKGYDDEWIERRIQTIDIRKQLTDEWKKRNIKEGQEFSILTAEIAKGTFGVIPSQHKEIKGLTNENLRDHMTPLELIFTALGEEVTRNLAVNDNAQGFEENHEIARKGGMLAGDARERIEKGGNLKVVSEKNYLNQIKDAENKNVLPPENTEG
jgi:DNA-damage-inducible protein D